MVLTDECGHDQLVPALKPRDAVAPALLPTGSYPRCSPAAGLGLTWAGNRITMTTGSVLIFAAVFAAAFGLLVWWLSRRRGKPEKALTIFLGIAGVCVGFWGVMTSLHRLYIPCVALILASYAYDFAPGCWTWPALTPAQARAASPPVLTRNWPLRSAPRRRSCPARSGRH